MLAQPRGPVHARARPPEHARAPQAPLHTIIPGFSEGRGEDRIRHHGRLEPAQAHAQFVANVVDTA